MKVTINPVLDMETLEWVSNDGAYEYDGPVILFGGPSKEAKANEKAQTDFYKSTTDQQKTTYGEQQDLLKLITGITVPIIAKGPQQFGYTPEVDALLKTTIADNAAQAEANAVNATRLAERQRTGGTDVLGTGAEAELEEQAHLLSEQDKAKQLSQEKLSGYQAGTSLYNNAVSQLSAATGNPVSYTQAATGAGQGATGAINLADSERSTLLSSLLQGAIGAGTTIATMGAGKAMSVPVPGCEIVARLYDEDFETGVRVNFVRELLSDGDNSSIPVIAKLHELYRPFEILPKALARKAAWDRFKNLSTAAQTWIKDELDQLFSHYLFEETVAV